MLTQEIEARDQALFELSSLMGLAHFVDLDVARMDVCRQEILRKILP